MNTPVRTPTTIELLLGYLVVVLTLALFVVSNNKEIQIVEIIKEVEVEVVKEVEKEVKEEVKEIQVAEKLEKKDLYVEAVRAVYRRNLPSEVADFIISESKRRGVPSDLVFGVIASESSFDPNAISSVGAIGYMQVWPKWHQDRIDGRDIYDPYVNIEVGIDYLAECLRLTNNTETALARYNGANTPESKARYNKRVSHRKGLLLDSIASITT